MRKIVFKFEYSFLIIEILCFFYFFQLDNFVNAQGIQSMNPNYSMYGYDIYGRPLNYRGEPIGSPLDEDCGAFGWKCIAKGVGTAVGAQIVEIVASIIKYIGWFFHYIISYVNFKIIAPIADYMLSLDPFNLGNGESPTERLWFIVKTFAYIILVFSSLFAGFQWVLGEDNNAKSLIFTIIIVALLIDFTYLFVKEAFYVVRAIETGISGEVSIVKEDGTVATGTASSKLGSLIAAVSWSKAPIQDIDRIVEDSSNIARTTANKYQNDSGDKNVEAIKNSLVAIGVSLFYVAFAMVIFIMLFIMVSLGFARYLILTFLAATSSFAVSTLAFPKFKPPFNTITSMVGDVFGSWLGHLTSWLLVIPVFGVMLILGVILQQNFMNTVERVSGITGAMQFIISLLIILGWFILSLRLAITLTGRVVDITRKFAMGALSWVGITMGGATMGRAISGLVGQGLGKVGDFLEKRSGFGWWGRQMYTASKWAKQTSKGLREKSVEHVVDVARDKLKSVSSALERARTPEETNKAFQDLINTIGEINKRPELAKMMKDEIKATSGYFVAKMSENKEASQQILSLISQLDVETQEGILSKISKYEAKKLISHMKDKTFADQINGLSPIILDVLSKKLGQLDPDEAIDILSDKELMDNLSETLKKGISKATKGFYEAMLKKEVESVADSLSNLSSEAFRIFGTIIDSMGNYKLSEDQQRTIIAQAFRRNASEIIRGMNRASKEERQKFQPKINEAFRSNPDVLRSMSDNDLRNIMIFIDNEILDQQLTDEQKRRLGIFQGPKIITASS